MNKDVQKDLLTSHGITNYLTAGFQGKFAFLNILSQLGGTFDLKDMQSTKDSIELVAKWTSSLWKGMPLFSAAWQTPQTFDSRKALELLEELKSSLTQFVERLVEILSAEDISSRPDDGKFLTAAYGRYAYSKDNYIRGLLEFAKVFKVEEIRASYEPHLDLAARDLQFAHDYLKRFKDTSQHPKEFYDQLLFESMKLPAIFRTHIHDINQLLANYAGGFTFEFAGIPEERAQLWKQLKVAPEIAGYWEAYYIGPEEAYAWSQVGIPHYAFATEWKRFGFDPMSALPWVQANFPVAAAAAWASAGFTTEKTLEMMDKGINDPEEAKRYVPDSEES